LNKVFCAYIISFLPLDNDVLRARRLKGTHRQLEWWLKFTDLKIYVVSMNYRQEDYFIDDTGKLEYIDNPPVNANIARHLLFEKFYNSDYDYGVFLDDDAAIYNDVQHNSGHNIFKEVENNLEYFKDNIDIFFPLNPRMMGFNPLYDEDRDKFDNHLVFVRSMNMNGTTFFCRNYKKHGDKVVMPDKDFNWLEDQKLALDNLVAGHSIYQCQNIILKEFGGENDSVFASDTKIRIAEMSKASEQIYQFFKDKGMKKKEVDGRVSLDKSTMVKRYWNGAREHIILKSGQPYTKNSLDNLF